MTDAPPPAARIAFGPHDFWGDRLLSLGKSKGFFDDPVFAAAYAAIHGSHQYDEYNSPHTIAWRLHTLVWAAKNGLNLPGDFVECGVFKGDFSWVVMQCTDWAKQDKTFYLYDTFDGFSPKHSSPDDFPDDGGQFWHFADGVYKDPEIYPAVLARFRDYRNVRIVRGVVPESLADAPRKIAFLHIDMNSAGAEIGALDVLFDRVVPGGMIVFDDYGWHQFRRQKEAEDAWMAAHGYQIMELPTGQGLVVKRNS